MPAKFAKELHARSAKLASAKSAVLAGKSSKYLSDAANIMQLSSSITYIDIRENYFLSIVFHAIK